MPLVAAAAVAVVCMLLVGLGGLRAGQKQGLATWERAARRRQRRQVVLCRRAALVARSQAGEDPQLTHRGPGRGRASPAAVGAATPSAAAGRAAA